MTVNERLVYVALADALEYPEDEDHGTRLAAAAMRLAEPAPAVASAVARLAAALDEGGLEHLQELYTQSFDLNPAASLDIGWHLFGESYKRGAFLVGLRQDLREHELAEGSELPDHLPCVLRLLAELEDGEHAELLLRSCVAPALIAILRTLRGREDHPYVPILEAASECFGPPIELESTPRLPVLHDRENEPIEEAAHG
ncbi:MAG: molecular chaperone TorD family protein [Sandaracinaceae bacterium]|nr:molecular chaperone TorD family protein [Sandaracinaceae bacterium]